ncbi:hypothetical protein LINPERHAP2_LOCUS12023 [Linum perenne]
MAKSVWKLSSFIKELDPLQTSTYLTVVLGLPIRHYSIEVQG